MSFQDKIRELADKAIGEGGLGDLQGSEGLSEEQLAEVKQQYAQDSKQQQLNKVRAGLSQIALLILESDMRTAGQGSVRPAKDSELRQLMSHQLGVTVDDLEEIVESVEEQYWEGVWEELLVEGKVSLALNSNIMRSSKWDELESVSLQKLNKLVMAGAVRSADSLLAIANAANRANRSNDKGRSPAMAQTVNVILGEQAHENEEGGVTLPSGNMGTIRLSLSSRVQRQLMTTPDSGSTVLRSSKMLNVSQLRALANGEAEDAEIIEPETDEESDR
jgi:hypothetical protein